jgi:hypothetical protein
MKINLNEINSELSRIESRRQDERGGGHKIGPPQVAEVMACLGNLLRTLPAWEALLVLACIWERAGGGVANPSAQRVPRCGIHGWLGRRLTPWSSLRKLSRGWQKVGGPKSNACDVDTTA